MESTLSGPSARPALESWVYQGLYEVLGDLGLGWGSKRARVLVLRVCSGLGITTSIFTEEPLKRIDGTITWARRKGAATRKADGKGRAYQTTKKCHPDGLSARACSLAIRPRLCALVFHLTSISF